MNDERYRIPTRGKDAPVAALEEALKQAQQDVAAGEGRVRSAKYQYEEAVKVHAVKRRNVDDLRRAIEAVRALPTAPLAGYVTQSQQDALAYVKENDDDEA